MSNQIEKEPPTIGAPPELPPYLRGTPRRRGRILIMPHISLLDHAYRLGCSINNWNTIFYFWMVRWDLDSNEMTSAIVHSRTYKGWLDTYDLSDHGGVPPHIGFGGCIKPGEPDPTFYPRWVEMVKKEYS